MSRPSPKRPRPADAAADPARLAAAIRQKITAGRSMGALQDANRFFKDHPGADARALLGEAYRARLQALAAAGMLREARELLDVARAKLPELGSAWEESAQDVAIQGGNLDELLRKWLASDGAPDPAGFGSGDPGAARAAAAANLQRAVKDPRQILASAVLPPDDPLRRDAAAVQEAFTQAAAGTPLPAASLLAALQQIPRRSPLAPWRQFVLALAAWHRGDDPAAQALLARIPDDCAPARLGLVLAALVRGESPAAGVGPTGSWLLEKASGGFFSARTNVRKLEAALAAGARRRTTDALVRILAVLAAKSPHLAARLVRWVHRESSDEQPLDVQEWEDAVQRAVPGDEYDRLYASAEPPSPPPATLLFWVTWLIPGRRAELRPLADVEVALVLDRLVPDVDDVVEELEDFLEDAGVDSNRLDHLRDLRQLAAEVGDGAEDPDTALHALWLDALGSLLAAVHARARMELPRSGDPAGALARCACRLAPTSERFRELLARVRRDGRRKEGPEEVLQEWARSFPQDVEPLLLEAERAERRSAHAQALAAIERAARLDPLHERVRAARFRILIGSLGAHLRKGQFPQATVDLEQLEQLPAAGTPERRRYLAAARLHVGTESGAPTEAVAAFAARLLEAAAGDPVAVAETRALVQADARRGAKPRPVEPTGKTAREQVASLVRLLRTARAVFGDPAARVALGEGETAWTAADLPAAPEDVLLLCEHAAAHEAWDLLHLLAGAGLRETGPLLARFLLFRSQALLHSGLWPEAMACAGAARHFAYRFQDQETAGALHEVFPAHVLDEEELDAVTIEQVVALERALDCRARARRRRPRQKEIGETAGPRRKRRRRGRGPAADVPRTRPAESERTDNGGGVPHADPRQGIFPFLPRSGESAS